MRALSDLERAVVVQLQEDGRRPFATVAADVGVSEATVRRTVQRLAKEGVIAITAVANPQLLGLQAMAWTGIRVRWPDGAELPRRLLEIRGVDYVVTTAGRFQIMAEIGARDMHDLHERLSRIRALPGVLGTETFLHFEMVHQEFRWDSGNAPSRQGPAFDVGGAGLSDVERKLLIELRRNGRRSFRQIARGADVSEHHIRAAYGRLSDQGVIRVIAVVNPRRLGLNQMAWVGLRVHPDADARETARSLVEGRRTDYAVICSGCYDILAELVCVDGADLMDALEHELGAIPAIAGMEVFTILDLHYEDESVWSVGRVSALEG
jgi:Lrp/AsnC family transcriptional regulator for asnA, asnC and gidA